TQAALRRAAAGFQLHGSTRPLERGQGKAGARAPHGHRPGGQDCRHDARGDLVVTDPFEEAGTAADRIACEKLRSASAPPASSLSRKRGKTLQRSLIE